MKLFYSKIYFVIALILSLGGSVLIGLGISDPLPFNIAIVLGLILNAGIILTGYFIWQEVPVNDQFSQKLNELARIALLSIIIPLSVFIPGGLYVSFAIILGAGLVNSFFLSQETKRQLRIKVSLIITNLIPILVVLSFIPFSVFRQQSQFFAMDSYLNLILIAVYSLAYAIIFYGITQIQHYTDGNGSDGSKYLPHEVPKTVKA